MAARRLDSYYERGIHARDVATSAFILEEVGGKVTDYREGELYLESRAIVASSGKMHLALTQLTGEGG